MEISIITTSNLSFDYILKCNSSYIYHNKQELHKILHETFLPRFYFMISNHNQLKLMYDAFHSKSFKVIIYYIRGYGKCSLLLMVEKNMLHIQVIEQKEILEVPANILYITSINDLNLKS